MDEGPAASAESAYHPLARTFAFEGLLGFAHRLDDGPDGKTVQKGNGLQLGAGLFFAPSRLVALGVRYIYSDLGLEKEGSAQTQGASANVYRRLHTVQGGFRLYPYEKGRFRAWAGLFVGASFEDSWAVGARVTQQYPVTADSYRVTLDSQVTVSGNAGLGVDYDATKNTGVFAGLNFSKHFFSSDPQTTDDPDINVSGIGPAMQLDFRLGVQYRFDLTGSHKDQSSQTARR